MTLRIVTIGRPDATGPSHRAGSVVAVRLAVGAGWVAVASVLGLAAAGCRR